MPDIMSFKCPNCGSSVNTDGTSKEAKCEYCGSTVIVPEELRSQPAPFSTSTFTSTPMETNFNGTIPGFNDDSLSKSIGTVAKVTAGVTVGVTAISVIIPIILTCVILGVVGAIMIFVFSSVNKTISSVAIPTDNFPTAAPTFVPDTAVPTLSPTPFNTPTPFTKVLLKDNFTNPSSGWDRANTADSTVEYMKGKYHVLIKTQKGSQVQWLGSKYTDMSVEVDVQQTAGPSDAEIGVACRVTNAGGFYAFEFTQDGQYGIYKSTNWSADPLAEGTLDPNTVSSTAANHIEGMCEGSTLTMLLNGQVLLQAQDSDYTKGGAGLIVTTGNSGDAGIDTLFSSFLAKGP